MLSFTTDYDRANPVTQKEGMLRRLNKQLEAEKDEEAKKQWMIEKEKA